MIIYDVLQRYYEERCSPESWSSLLTSQRRFRGISSALTVCQKKVVLKDDTITKCLVVYSHDPTLNTELNNSF